MRWQEEACFPLVASFFEGIVYPLFAATGERELRELARKKSVGRGQLGKDRHGKDRHGKDRLRDELE